MAVGIDYCIGFLGSSVSIMVGRIGLAAKVFGGEVRQSDIIGRCGCW